MTQPDFPPTTVSGPDLSEVSLEDLSAEVKRRAEASGLSSRDSLEHLAHPRASNPYAVNPLDSDGPVNPAAFAPILIAALCLAVGELAGKAMRMPVSDALFAIGLDDNTVELVTRAAASSPRRPPLTQVRSRTVSSW